MTLFPLILMHINCQKNKTIKQWVMHIARESGRKSIGIGVDWWIPMHIARKQQSAGIGKEEETGIPMPESGKTHEGSIGIEVKGSISMPEL